MYALFSHEQYTTQAPPFYQSDLNSTDNDQLEILFAWLEEAWTSM